MNIHRFDCAMQVALNAFDKQQGDAFTCAIQIAADAIPDYPRSQWLLHYALSQYPAPDVPDILHTIAGYLPSQLESTK